MLKQSLAAWDIDCDGKQNLIAQAEGALGIAVYDLDAPFNTLQPWLTNPWPMRYRDDRNTGRMIAEPPVGIQVTLSEPETDRDGWVTLRWTCPETVSGFRVQRMSREQGGWEPLATVPGHGAEGLQHYVYRDHPPAPGVFVYRVDPVRMDGTPQTGPTVEVTLGMYGARALAIQRALPDPLPQGGVASISFSLPGSGSGSVPVALHVHDVLGRSVRTLADDARPSGFYTVYWDGRDAAGRLLPTGVYVIRLESRGRIASARMLVVR
jgi:hypothetical protein